MTSLALVLLVSSWSLVPISSTELTHSSIGIIFNNIKRSIKLQQLYALLRFRYVYQLSFHCHLHQFGNNQSVIGNIVQNLPKSFFIKELFFWSCHRLFKDSPCWVRLPRKQGGILTQLELALTSHMTRSQCYQTQHVQGSVLGNWGLDNIAPGGVIRLGLGRLGQA